MRVSRTPIALLLAFACADATSGQEANPSPDALRSAFEQAYSGFQLPEPERQSPPSTVFRPQTTLAENKPVAVSQMASAQASVPSTVQIAIPPAEPQFPDAGRAGDVPANGIDHSDIPEQEVAWWQELVQQPFGGRNFHNIDPDTLVRMALLNAPGILAISQEPLIQETEIEIADAAFDVEMFLKTRYDDRVDPVGNVLTTGGEPFLKDNIWSATGGIRRKLYSGGKVEIGQRLGFQNSNNRFFTPQDQGTATLSLNFSQPLLRGSGAAYNRSQVLIAEAGTGIAWDKYSAELQAQLSTLVEAYWNLAFRRAVLLQKRQNVERGEVVLLKLEGRSTLDSLPSQIARARAAVRARATEVIVAERDMRDAETVIRRILGSQEAFSANAPELVPAESAVLVPDSMPMENAISEAMQNRGEVKQALQKARIAAIQCDMAANELRPELNLIFDTYVSALRDETNILGAWSDQFSGSTPGFAGGLEFSMPWGRRAANAKLTRQQLVAEQIRHEIDATVHEVVSDAQIAWRRLHTAWQAVQVAREAIDAARADLMQNEARWEAFALVEGDLTDGQTPTTLLDQLLDAQQRLANAELTWAQNTADYKIAEINLKRATGSLMNYYQ